MHELQIALAYRCGGSTGFTPVSRLTAASIEDAAPGSVQPEANSRTAPRRRADGTTAAMRVKRT